MPTTDPVTPTSSTITPPPPAVNAKATELKEVSLPRVGVDVDRSQLPELPQLEGLRSGRSLLERLKPEQRAQAEGYAGQKTFEDAMDIQKIGVEQQEDSKRVIKLTGKLIRDDARIMDLGEVGKLADELKAKMVELGVGRLEEKWYHKAIRAVPVLGERVDRLGAFLARFDKITTRLEEVLKAMADEKVNLETLHEKAKHIVGVNKQALDNLTVAAASVEIMLRQKEAEFKKEMERYKTMESLDDEDLEAINGMRRTLSALDRKLVTLKVQRVETRTSIRTMKDLMDAMVEARSILDDQITLQESIWRNQINNGILEHKLRGVNGMIRNSREFTNKLIQQNQTNVSETIRDLKQMAGEPGVDIAILKGAVDAQKRLHEAMLEASIENRKKLGQAAATLDKLDQEIGEDGKDLPTLMKMLEVESDDIELPTVGKKKKT